MRYILYTPLFITLFAQPSHAAIVGSWCDRMIPNLPQFNRIITIVKSNGGEILAVSRFADGSKKTDWLEEKSGSIYKLIGSDSGDYFEVNFRGTSLKLFDEAGFIRDAARIKNGSSKSECLS